MSLAAIIPERFERHALDIYAQRIDRKHAKFERQVTAIFARHFRRESTRTLPSIRSYVRRNATSQVEAAAVKRDILSMLAKIQDGPDKDLLVSELHAVFGRIGTSFGFDATSSLGFKYPGAPKSFDGWLKRYAGKTADQINKTSRIRIADKIIRLDKEKLSAVQINLRTKSEYVGFEMNRAPTIAFTTTGTVAGKSGYDIVRRLGINVNELIKQWITKKDNRVRDTHQQLHGKKLPYKSIFANGLRYPKDPKGELREVINCRCFLKYLRGSVKKRSTPSLVPTKKPKKIATPQLSPRQIREKLKPMLEEQELELERIRNVRSEIGSNIKKTFEKRFIALKAGDKSTANKLFKQIVSIETESKEITRLMNKVQESFAVKQRQLIQSSKPIRIKVKTEGIGKRTAMKWSKGGNELGKIINKNLVKGDVPVKSTRRKRAFFAGGRIHLNAQSDLGIFLHESGHWIEENNTAIHQKAVEFFKQRTKGEVARQLRVLKPGFRYGFDEIAKKDKFVDPYVGRIYGNEKDPFATEIISMGLEWLWRRPAEFAKLDPAHFDFMIGIIRGGL